MRLSIRLLAVSLFAVVVTAAAAGTSLRLAATSSAPVQGQVTASRPDQGRTVPFVLRAVGQSACGQCEAKVAPLTQACKDGSIKSCYLAAAALCQCNLDAGGCGSDRDALRECVRDNKRLADELK
jgi:hypothetical protein